MKAPLHAKNKQRRILGALFGALVSVFALIGGMGGFGVADAAAPARTLGFQGQLFNSGTAVDSSVSATFTFYDALSGGSQAGSAVSKTVAVDNGYFSTSFDESDLSGIDWSQSLWIEVSIEGNVLSPRSAINAVPFAERAFGTFSYSAAPSVGPAGSLYYNSATGALLVSNGSSWTSVGASSATTTLAVGNGFLYAATSTDGVKAAYFVATSTTATSTFAGAVGIGTTTPTANFEVAGRDSSFNSSQDGSLGEWSTNANALPAERRYPSTVVANGYVYVLGGSNGSDVAQSTVYYAKLNADGSTGAWNTNANALPAARSRGSSVVANGYIYMIGGNNGSNAAQTTIYYAQLNADGSTGAWQTNTNVLPAVRLGHSSVIANGYIYVIGGQGPASANQSTVYYAKLNADGSTGAWSTNANALPAVRAMQGSIVANGYVYVIGGQDAAYAQVATVYSARLNADGTTGAWSTTTSMPGARGHQGVSASNGYVYVLGGYDAAYATYATIFYAKLNSDGTVGSWSTNTSSLPTTAVANTSVVANGYVYSIGRAGSSAIYYASTARIKMAGTLDLLGLTIGSGGMTGSSGDAGGSIYAGNIYSANKLEVGGNAQFWNGLSVNGAMSIFAATSTATSSMVFNIAGTSTPILSILGNGNVGIGSSTPAGKLVVKGDGTGTGIAFTTTNSSNAMKFVILDNGSVGIGTSSPIATLSIAGTAGTNPFVIASSTGTQMLTLSQSGNLGFGSTTPGSTLSGPLASTFSIAASSPVQASASVAGNALTIRASNAVEGTNPTNPANGGSLTLTAGNGVCGAGCGTADAGGSISLTSGNSVNGTGGSLVFTTGNGGGASSGGSFTVTTGSGGSANGVGGAINLLTTSSAGNTTAGSILLKTLSSGGATPGDITLQTGNSGQATMGTINLITSTNIETAASRPGGPLQITLGAGSSNTTSTGIGGTGGSMTITLGAGGVSSGNTSGTGGAASAYRLEGGAGGNATGAGGTHLGGTGSVLTLTSGAGGNATGASGTRTGGNSGSLILKIGAVGTGATANGVFGSVQIAPTGGSVVIGTSTPWAKLSIQQASGATLPLFNIASTTSAAFATSSVFTVLANGNIGIGTAAPDKSLEISSALNASTTVGLRIRNPTTSAGTGGAIDFFNTTGTGNDNFAGVRISAIRQTDSSNDLAFFINPNVTLTERLRIKGTSGNIGIGTSSPAAALDIWGNLQVGTSSTPLIFANTATSKVGIGQASPATMLHVGSTAVADATNLLRLQDADSTCDFNANSGSPSCGSDATLKKNIVSIHGHLDKVLALRPVSYNWNTDSDGTDAKIGFIAQEVGLVMPELVRDGTWIDGTTRKFLSTGGMMPYLVGAVQEQQLLIGDSASSTASVSEITLFVDAAEIEVPRTALSYVMDKINAGARPLLDFMTVRITAVRGYFDEVFAKKVHTDQLCVGNTCVTEDQLKALMSDREASVINPVLPVADPVEIPDLLPAPSITEPDVDDPVVDEQVVAPAEPVPPAVEIPETTPSPQSDPAPAPAPEPVASVPSTE